LGWAGKNGFRAKNRKREFGPKKWLANLIQGFLFESKRVLNISKLLNWIQNRLNSNRVLETFEKWKSRFWFKIQI
jgi:hypothetical protein